MFASRALFYTVPSGSKCGKLTWICIRWSKMSQVSSGSIHVPGICHINTHPDVCSLLPDRQIWEVIGNRSFPRQTEAGYSVQVSLQMDLWCLLYSLSNPGVDSGLFEAQFTSTEEFTMFRLHPQPHWPPTQIPMYTHTFTILPVIMLSISGSNKGTFTFIFE